MFIMSAETMQWIAVFSVQDQQDFISLLRVWLTHIEPSTTLKIIVAFDLFRLYNWNTVEAVSCRI